MAQSQFAITCVKWSPYNTCMLCGSLYIATIADTDGLFAFCTDILHKMTNYLQTKLTLLYMLHAVGWSVSAVSSDPPCNNDITAEGALFLQTPHFGHYDIKNLFHKCSYII